MPGQILGQDVSPELHTNKYFASYNRPFFDEIYTLSGSRRKAEREGDFWSYERSPRAQIFKRDNSKVEDMESMIELMRSNNYMTDPLSACPNCSPGYSASYAISARQTLTYSLGNAKLLRFKKTCYPLPGIE